MDSSQDRLYALDNLRAIMMWLGIVLHVAMHHVTMPFHLPMRDERTTVVADFLGIFIHAFRMPVFFIVAGFLAAMLLERRGPREFLKHRMKRLALPFAVFWPFIYVSVGVAMLAYLNRMKLGVWGLDKSVVPPQMGQTGQPFTAHMWFLWLLIWFCVAMAGLALLPRGPFARMGEWLARIGKAWWGFALLTVPLVIAGTGYPRGILQASGHFLLPWNEWLHNVVFFIFGVALWPHRQELLPHYQRHWQRYARAGLAVFLVLGGIDKRVPGTPWQVFSFGYNALAWLWGFAWIGLALNVLERRNAVLGYLADSAYWVYLLHLPIAIGIASLLYQQPLPALVKILVNIAVTTVLCLGSYELFVRHTWISVLLNGKRHPRRGAAPPGEPTASAA